MKKGLITVLMLLGMAFVMPGCASGTQSGNVPEGTNTAEGTSAAENGETADNTGTEGTVQTDLHKDVYSLPIQVIDDKYRTYYEVFVYSFYDSDDNGIGDLKGLTEKLDYINDGDISTNTDLGCNGIWLMPIMPSTTYHKYDVTDYCAIDKEYGTMEDFEAFMSACEERDIHVLIDLVINHTSSKHPWFTEAVSYLQNLGDGEPSVTDCPYFEYYNFSKEKKSSNWYQVSGTEWYYEAPFWSEMPDLNLYSEAVRAEIAEITQFWLDKGVAGFRLDAAKEYVSDATSSNVEILTWLNDTVKAQKEDAYIVAEVWTDADTYAKYYASGIDSTFDFQFASQDGIIACTLNGTGGKSPVVYGSAVEKVADRLSEYNADFIDAPFYTNHDMGRSAGYYAGEGSTEKTKIAQAMNLLMSGNAFLYYGEELGMKGAGKDENKRAPMQWSADTAAEGMCDGPEYMDSIKMKFGSLEEQEADAASVYNYVKAVIHVRNAFPEIARGNTEYMEEISDEQVCVFRKTYEDSEILLLYNLSAEPVTLDRSGVTVNGQEWSSLLAKAVLLTGEEQITEEDTTLVLPPYSVCLYQ
ncbi:MAG: alpha-amylase family glycosyl hydrolase [Lachnospiraceae bacterium]|nr:alpha-amylase family glycosyl hydrolase [Lachnospiraceae bacterium]